MDEPSATPPEESNSSPAPTLAGATPPPTVRSDEEPRATAGQVAAVAGSVGLLVGFAAGLLVASTGSEGRYDALAQPAPVTGAASSVASAPVAGPASPPPSAPATEAPPVQATDSFHLDLRREDHRSLMVSGFHGVEGIDTDKPAVWSQGLTSTIALPLTPSEGDYRLTLTAGAFEPIAPLLVTLRLNGKRLDKVTIPAAPGNIEVAVPNQQLKAGKNELVLSYPRTARPVATIRGATDDRELAFNLFGLDLRPK